MKNLQDTICNPLKISGDSKNILFTGCLHIGHLCNSWNVPLWRARGFDSVREHDAAIIKRWNARANDETIAFFLGDTMFGSGGAERFHIILDSLNFKELYLLPGNHTAGLRQVCDQVAGNSFPIGKKRVTLVTNYLEAFINGTPVVMSHYPILSWNGMARGSVHLFAHVHNNLDKSELGRLYLEKCRAVEVSYDAHPDFLSLQDIFDLVKDKESYAPDHYDSSTQNPF